MVRVHPVNGVRVVRLEGEIDLATVVEHEARLEREAAGASELVIDLSGVVFLDSSGVSMLFRAVNRFRDRDRRVTFVAPQGSPAAAVLRIRQLGLTASVVDRHDAAFADGAG